MAAKLLGAACLFAAVAWYFRNTFDPRTLQGKRVLITGASSGIGEQLAYEYSKYEAQVILVARRENKLKEVVSKCRRLGAKQPHYIIADLSTLEAAKKVHREIIETVQDIDILVLNHVKQFSESWTSGSDLSKVPLLFEVNTLSYINLATLFLPELQKSNGSIIVVSSVMGTMGGMRETVYSATKHALHGFFDSLRQDLMLAGHKKLSVTTCVIGPIDTESAKIFQTNVRSRVTWYPADECALAIIQGGAMRLRQMYYPYFTKPLEVVQFFMPELIETVMHIHIGELSFLEGVMRYFRFD